jgi:hypothetical protein
MQCDGAVPARYRKRSTREIQTKLADRNFEQRLRRRATPARVRCEKAA